MPYNDVVNSVRKNAHWYFLLLLALAAAFVWYAVVRESRGGKLTVSFLDIGQGDAIFIESPEGNQMMIDGGPDRSVLRELGSVMPFYDRSIDILLVSNPDKDHMAGFIDILSSFNVARVIEPGTRPTTAVYKEFERAVAEESAQKIIARRRMNIKLGRQTNFEIIFPDRDTSGLDTNTGSIIGKLTFGRTCFIFPGDAPKAVEEYVVTLEGKNLDCEVLKVGHHGSRTSTDAPFLAAVSPALAVISAGKDNRYGHPHKEVIERLSDFEIKTLGTYKDGRVILVSDGNTIRVR